MDPGRACAFLDAPQATRRRRWPPRCSAAGINSSGAFEVYNISRSAISCTTTFHSAMSTSGHESWEATPTFFGREQLNGDCPKRDAHSMLERCDLICPDLPKVL
jgi:hypothetical protein